MERPECGPGASGPIRACFHSREREKNCPLLLPSISLTWVSGEDAKHLGQRRPGSFQKGMLIQATDGMAHLGVGIVRYASHAGDGPGGNLELLGNYYGCRDAVHLQFYTVVQTALAARASVPDGEDCCVALLGYLFNQVRGGGPGGVGLGESDDTGIGGFLFEEVSEPIQ